jgi:hypothetical protein
MKFKNECHTTFHIEYLALIHIASNPMQIFCCKVEKEIRDFLIFIAIVEKFEKLLLKTRYRHLAIH